DVAPILRGLLAPRTGSADDPYRRVILRPLITRAALDFVDAPGGRALALAPPVTPDHLIRTKAPPMWVGDPEYDKPDALRGRLAQAIESYAQEYRAYLDRNTPRMTLALAHLDPLPRVVLVPGIGAICAGFDARAAEIARDVTERTLAVKSLATA